MRTLAALAIYVSLTAGIRAEGPQPLEETTSLRNLDQNPGQASHQPIRANEVRIVQAREWLERARRDWNTDPQQHLKLVVAAADLANLYRNAGDYPKAEQVLREVLAQPCTDAEVAGLVRNNLADLLREEGRADEAEPLFQQSIDSAGVSSRQRAGALIGLADIDRQYRRWDASIRKWNVALEISRQGQDERTEAIVLRGLGITWLESGSAARAEPLLRRSVRMLENDSDAPPEAVAGVLSALGELYRQENKLALAEDEWSHALKLERANFGEVHPQVAWLMEMLSDVFSARAEFLLARDYATRASQMMSASFGEDSMPLASALANRALVEQRAGELHTAAEDYERAIRIARAQPEHQPVEEAMIQRYAGLLKAMHRAREAKALLARRDVPVRSLALK